jgi:hypothetical protein
MKFGYTIVYVDDVRATIDFYTQAFGFEPGFLSDDNGTIDYGELQTGAVTLAFANHSLGVNIKRCHRMACRLAVNWRLSMTMCKRPTIGRSRREPPASNPRPKNLGDKRWPMCGRRKAH